MVVVGVEWSGCGVCFGDEKGFYVEFNIMLPYVRYFLQ
jgi:hypothetical protein